MILYRSLRAIPYVVVAFIFGGAVGWLWDQSILLMAIVNAALAALMIGRTIWKERHEWNAMEHRAQRHGTSLWRLG